MTDTIQPFKSKAWQTRFNFSKVRKTANMDSSLLYILFPGHPVKEVLSLHICGLFKLFIYLPCHNRKFFIRLCRHSETCHSTVTDFARFLGLSTSSPLPHWRNSPLAATVRLQDWLQEWFGLRYINCEICRIFNIIISIGRQPHQISSTALDLHHIADRLFKRAACVATPTTRIPSSIRLIVPCFSSPAA